MPVARVVDERRRPGAPGRPPGRRPSAGPTGRTGPRRAPRADTAYLLVSSSATALETGTVAGDEHEVVLARSRADGRTSCPMPARGAGDEGRGSRRPLCSHAPHPRDRPSARRSRVTDCAHRHLERQLHPRPHRPRRGLARAQRRRRAGPAGDQVPGRPVPGRCGSRRSATRSPTSASSSGTASRSSPGSASTTSRSASRHAALGRPAGAEARALGATCGGVRVWSLYVPNGRALGDPHLRLQAATGWTRLRDAGRRLARRRPGRAGRARRRLEHRTAGRGRLGHGVFEGTARTSRAPERAAFQAVVDAGFADVVRPHTPGPGIYTYWDYTQLRFPKPRGHADRLRARLPRARRAGRPGALIDREERKGKGARDHAPVVFQVGE